MCDNLVPNISLPKIFFDQVTHQMFVDADEFTGKDSSCVGICSKWLETLVVTKHLGGRGGGHWRNQKRVPCSKLDSILTESIPVIPIGARFDVPKIKLEFALRQR